MSRDRVGIVFDVSNAISKLHGDIADIRQSVLRGYFTMILYTSFPAAVTLAEVKQTLADVDSSGDTPLEISVKPVADLDDIPPTASPEHTYVFTASGQDRIGFVAAVSQFCAENNINILDLSTTVASGQYTMILLVDLSRCASIDAIRRRLNAFKQQAGVQIVLQHYDIFKATNEIKL
jgi:predicted amino acid-binding ACT domain protein